MGCSALAFGQTVEQRIDSLQMLIGQQTILHLKATAPKGAKVVMPYFKPQDQIIPGIEVVELNGDTSQVGDDQMVVTRDYHGAGGYGSSQPVLSSQDGAG